MINELLVGDCLEILKKIPDNFCDAIITDPPYFIHGLDNNWKSESSITKNSVVSSLSSGMKFDRNQGKKFYEWYLKVSKELFRVVKPGAFFFSFSAPRLYHNCASAMEDSGFNIRDQFLWIYTLSQSKAMGLNHVINRLKISDEEKESLKQHLAGWKTPQVKSCHEPIVMGQKPLEGQFLDNYRKYGVGLINSENKIGDNMFPSNVMSDVEELDRWFLVPKSRKEGFNFHKTVKPISLMKYLIGLVTREDDIILEPFLGSGTTVLAAKEMKRNYIGMDINLEYVEIARKRCLKSVKQ